MGDIFQRIYLEISSFNRYLSRISFTILVEISFEKVKFFSHADNNSMKHGINIEE